MASLTISVEGCRPRWDCRLRNSPTIPETIGVAKLVPEWSEASSPTTGARIPWVPYYVGK